MQNDTDNPEAAGDGASSCLLSCQNAAFGYDGGIVVHDLVFSVEKSDYLCVIGENGSGKSTLIKGILRLINPMRGRLNMNIKRNEIGYLSQQTALQKDFPAGVFEIVLSGNLSKMGVRPFYSRKEKEIAAVNMERLGIAGLKDCCYRELSGGQQRRVLIARALCASSKMLVLDEPAASLDPLVISELYNLLKTINQTMNMTIIMVSHDINAAVKYANRILHIKNKQLFFGDTGEYVQSGVGDMYLNTGDKI
jgi:zinc transport system ATP-binding protein